MTREKWLFLCIKAGNQGGDRRRQNDDPALISILHDVLLLSAFAVFRPLPRVCLFVAGNRWSIFSRRSGRPGAAGPRWWPPRNGPGNARPMGRLFPIRVAGLAPTRRYNPISAGGMSKPKPDVRFARLDREVRSGRPGKVMSGG